MKRPDGTAFGFVCSFLLHAFIILLFWVGLPFMDRMPLEPPRPIPIDVVTVDQISQAPRPKPKPEKKPTPTLPEEKPVEEKPVEPEKEVPLIPLEEKKKPEPPQEKPKIDKNPSEVPLPEKKPEKKVEKKEEKKKEKPKPKKEKKKEAKEKTRKSFLSVLKNIETSKEEDVSDSPETDLTSDSNSAADKISDKLTISEIDLIKRQLTECWNIPAGAKDANDLIVVLDLDMNPDGTVKNASVIEGKSSSRHPFYRAGAESALRAVRNPKCVPLKLPLDRYDSWKTFEITFNPKDMR